MRHDSCIWDMTRTWIKYDVPHSYETWRMYMRHDSFNMRHDSFIWDMTPLYVYMTAMLSRFAVRSELSVTWLIHTRHDSSIWDMTHSYETWLLYVYMCRQTEVYSSFIIRINLPRRFISTLSWPHPQFRSFLRCDPKFCLRQSCSAWIWTNMFRHSVAKVGGKGTATRWRCRIKQNWLQEPIEGTKSIWVVKHMNKCLCWSAAAMPAAALRAAAILGGGGGNPPKWGKSPPQILGGENWICSMKFHHPQKFHHPPSIISACANKWGNPPLKTHRFPMNI